MIYVCKCEDNCYYIGRTERGVERILEHLAEQGSEWTRLHKPVEVVEQQQGDGFIEDAITKRYFAKHGLDRVRGGSYSTLQIPITTRQLIIREIRGATDCCFNCGLPDHFVQNCPSKKSQCTRCGRNSHSVEQCYATSHLDGSKLKAKADNEGCALM